MHLVYLQEGCSYGVDALRERCFGNARPWAGTEADAFFERLADAMNRGAKIVRRSEGRYTFEFVGLFDFTDDVTRENLTFFFWPKFVSKGTLERFEKEDGVADRDEARNAILLAIDRCHKEMRLPDVSGDRPDAEKESLLELAVRVLRDYLENGVYTVRPRELEHNGQGEIDWNETIDRNQPVFLKGPSARSRPRPCYVDTATEISVPDENHYLTRLHNCLVTTWGRKLEDLGLASVLRVNVPLLSEDELDYFGDPEEQLDRIDKELGVQFVTKSRTTLTLMRELIERASESETELRDQLSFGMNKAEHLWEAACAAVLGSELDAKIGDCGLVWSQDITFRDYMPRPIWKRIGQGSSGSSDEKAYELENKQSGWRLDFIRTYPPKREPTTPVTKLVILDAKYYTVSWDKNNQTISGQPGIGDIAKQIFYQKAFEDLLRIKREDPAIDFVNAFLFPKDDGDSAEIALGETVHLGWTEPQRSAAAFSDVNLFTVYIPGIKLLEKYANGIIEDDWFEKIATGQQVAPLMPLARGAT